MDIINIFHNHTDKSLIILDVLKELAPSYGFSLNEEFDDQAKINLCIGGDGAFLRAVHGANFSPIPFVGIKTGTLGFFQEIQADELERFLTNLKEKKYMKSSLYLVQASIKMGKEIRNLYALNDFVLASKDHSVVNISVSIDKNHLQNFAGDGLIVSTPAGSTAYNFSVGGSILYQELKGYQLSPIAPINSKAYRSLLNSLVLSDKETLTMVPSDNCQLIVDGYIIESQIDEVSFTMPGNYINRLVFDTNYYWQNIKDKFL